MDIQIPQRTRTSIRARTRAPGMGLLARARRLGQTAAHIVARGRQRLLSETGDVPGWVLITLMTAALVVILAAVAGPALSALFQQAIDRVSGL